MSEDYHSFCVIRSDVFLFLFGSLLMLLTTVLFVPGSVVERFVCQPLTDPDLEFIDKVICSLDLGQWVFLFNTYLLVPSWIVGWEIIVCSPSLIRFLDLKLSGIHLTEIMLRVVIIYGQYFIDAS